MASRTPVGTGLSWLVVAYQRVLSPLLGARCRFHPSCSSYAVEALRVHGAARGGALVLWRLLRCQPFHPGGLDPVPPRHSRSPAVTAGRSGVLR